MITRNRTDSSTNNHATDGELIALIDREPIKRSAELRRHFLDCPDCGRRLGVLRDASDRASCALGTIEMPPLDSVRIRRRLEAERSRQGPKSWIAPVGRVAAAMLVIAGAAAASPPARAWIARHVLGRVVSAPSSKAVHTAVPATPIPEQAASSVVWFVPSADELIIRFDTRPADGVLSLSVSGAREASAQITARLETESLLILPSELHIRNGVRSSANYRVTVPATVRTIRLVVGDEAVRRFVAGPALRETIRLAGARP